MAKIIGTMTTGSVIDIDTPQYQIDTTTTASVTYIRWENNDVDRILIQRIDESGAIAKIQFTKAIWANRVTATYTP